MSEVESNNENIELQDNETLDETENNDTPPDTQTDKQTTNEDTNTDNGDQNDNSVPGNDQVLEKDTVRSRIRSAVDSVSWDSDGDSPCDVTPFESVSDVNSVKDTPHYNMVTYDDTDNVYIFQKRPPPKKEAAVVTAVSI